MTISNTLDITELDKIFSNLRKGRQSFMVDHHYVVSDTIGNDSGQISFTEEEMHIEVDNFPAQKKHFKIDLPIETYEQFNKEVTRTGLTLVNHKKQGTSMIVINIFKDRKPVFSSIIEQDKLKESLSIASNMLADRIVLLYLDGISINCKFPISEHEEISILNSVKQEFDFEEQRQETLRQTKPNNLIA